MRTKATPSPKNTRTSKPEPSRTRLALICLGLAALVFAAYANSLGNGFVWDDHEQILLNPAVKPDAPLAPIFTSDVRFTARSQSIQGKDYRPLQMLTYRLLYGTFGPEANPFHLVSVLFAMACTIAAFAVFWRLTRRWQLAAAAAALFAVHPVHAEAVDWIAAVVDPAFVLFLLLALFFFLGAYAKPRIHWPTAALSWLAFAVALLWKETAVIFPLLILAYALLFPHDIKTRMRTALLQSAPYFAVLALYLAGRISVLDGLSPGLRDWQLTVPQFALNALSLMAAYIAKLALPIGLNAYYVFTPIRSFTDTHALIGILAALATIAAIVFLLRRPSTTETTQQPSSRTLALFAVLWIILTIVPALDLSALGRNAFTERYLYLPSFGFCLLLALAASWLLDRLPKNLRTPVGCAALLLVVIGYTTETIARNPDWKDDATLFAVTLASSPDSPFVRNMVAANQSSDLAQTTEAQRNYEQAIQLANSENPPDLLDAVVAYQGLASTFADQGNFQQALQTLAEADRIDPDDANTDGEKGMILARAGDGKDAEPLLEHALAEEPYNENSLSALGLVLRDDGAGVEASVTLPLRAVPVGR